MNQLIEKFLPFSYQIFENEDQFSSIIESNIQQNENKSCYFEFPIVHDRNANLVSSFQTISLYFVQLISTNIQLRFPMQLVKSNFNRGKKFLSKRNQSNFGKMTFFPIRIRIFTSIEHELGSLFKYGILFRSLFEQHCSIGRNIYV